MNVRKKGKERKGEKKKEYGHGKTKKD